MAIALNPNYASAHQEYGEFLTCLGRFEEAFKEFVLFIDDLCRDGQSRERAPAYFPDNAGCQNIPSLVNI